MFSGIKIAVVMATTLIVMQGCGGEALQSNADSGKEHISTMKDNKNGTQGEESTMHINAGLDPEVFNHLKKNSLNATEKKLDVKISDLNKKNARLNLTLHFKENSDEVKLNGAIKLQERAIGLQGDGYAIPVEIDGKSYYFISYDAAFKGINFSKAEKENLENGQTNGGGYLYVEKGNPEAFTGSITIGMIESSSVMVFGDNPEVAVKIKKHLKSLQGGEDK